MYKLLVRFSFFAFLVALSCGVMAQGQKITKTFAYKDGREMLMDIIVPDSARGDGMTVVAVFGGGFVNGSRDNELQTNIAQALTKRGYIVVNIDYRLGLQDSVMVSENSSLRRLPYLFEYCIRLAVEDCCDAIAYLCRHCQEYGIDTSRIVLTGSSAGAISVLQTDYCRANGSKDAQALPKGWVPLAVVPYAGAIQCKNKAFRYNTPPAPTMFLHGTKDKIVAYKRLPNSLSVSLFGSARLYKEFKKHGYPCWILRYEGIGHEVASFLPSSVELFCAFVEQVNNGRTTWLDATVRDKNLVPTEWTTMTLKDLYK